MLIRIIHIVNICTLLVSTIGVATYSHYCQDKLKTIAFFVNTIKPCCLKAEQACSAKHSEKIKKCCSSKKRAAVCCSNKTQSEKPSLKRKNCCVDKKAYFQSDIETVTNDAALTFLFKNAISPVSNLIYAIRSYVLYNNIQEISYASLSFFPPPKIPLYIWYQSFLC